MMTGVKTDGGKGTSTGGLSPLFGKWGLVVSMLLLSIILWGAIYMIGEEMVRRLDVEIARGMEGFR